MQPLDLRVDGGEESWHAEPSFAVRWRNPASDPAVAAVHYRLLDPDGTAALAESRIGWATTSIQPLTVPSIPGAYRAEIWLEDAAGGVGEPVSVVLRFDDAAPGPVGPLPVPGWISRNAFPLTLRLSPAGGVEPLAGIRGYAASLDLAPEGSPCADALTCSEAETNLLGAASRTLTVNDLPEGTSYLHAVAVSGSGIRSAEVGSTALRVDETDPVTTLAGVPDGWSNRPLRLTVTATDSGSGMEASGSGGPLTAIRVDDGAPVVAEGDAISATVIESGAHTIAYYARDAAGNVDDGGTANGHRNHDPERVVARVDREPPRAAFANSQDPADPERIEAHVADALSGIDPHRGSIAVRPLGSGGSFAALPTENVDGVLCARWDSGASPPGEYELRAVAYDRAGNATVTTTRSNGSSMRLQAPLKTETRLSTSLGGNSHRVLPYGGRVALDGRLIAGRHTPLVGAPVTIVERFAEGAQTAQRATEVDTGTGGRFHLLLRPGPTREVLAVAGATRTLRGASSGPLRVEVRGGVRLKASARVAKVGGAPIVFSGRVLGMPAASRAAGTPVELQFSLPGVPWSEFRTVRANRWGRFRYAYRFADDDSRGVRFRFRAFVPPQAGWPFEPAGSAPVTVIGR
ncbi:MAG TPA: hypothetical protein VF245_03845 [Solirubrobacterales bacterium]